MDSKKHGLGTMTFASGSKYYSLDTYAGEWMDDEMNGQGKGTFRDGTIKEGQWRRWKDDFG